MNIQTANSLDISSSGSITLDASDSIIYQVNGTTYGKFTGDANGDLTIASGSGGNITLDASGGSINLYDGSTQYGTFSSDSNNNLTIQSDASGSIILNALDSSGNIATGVSIGSGGNNLELYYDNDNGFMNIQTANSLDISSSGSITLDASDSIIYQVNSTTYGKFTGDANGDLTIASGNTDSNIILDASNIILNTNSITSDENIFFVADANSTSLLPTKFSIGNVPSSNLSLYCQYYPPNSTATNATNATLIMDCPNFLSLTCSNSIFLNSGNNSINLQNDGTTYGTFYSDASGDLNISPSGSGNLNLELGTSGWYVSLGDISNNTIPNNIPSNAKLSLNYTSSTMYISAPNDLFIESLGSVTLVAGDGIIDLYEGTTQYGSFSTSGSNNLTIDAGSGGTVTTSYVAPWNPGGKGIINQQALAGVSTNANYGITGGGGNGGGVINTCLSNINIVYTNNNYTTGDLITITNNNFSGLLMVSIFSVLNMGESSVYILFVVPANDSQGNNLSTGIDLLGTNFWTLNCPSNNVFSFNIPSAYFINGQPQVSGSMSIMQIG
jgi:hypothetical protein